MARRVLGAPQQQYSRGAERGRRGMPPCARSDVETSVVFWSSSRRVALAFHRGLVGCMCVLPYERAHTGAMNLQTFSHVAFGVQITGPRHQTQAPRMLVKVSLNVFCVGHGYHRRIPCRVRAASMPGVRALTRVVDESGSASPWAL